MDEIIPTLRSIRLTVISSDRTRTLTELIRNYLCGVSLREGIKQLEYSNSKFSCPAFQFLFKLNRAKALHSRFLYSYNPTIPQSLNPTISIALFMRHI